MKKPLSSPDTSPKAEPAPRPVCLCCKFHDPVGGASFGEESDLCEICEHVQGLVPEDGMDSPAGMAILLAVSWIGNRLRRDILSGHES